ncbi:TOMM system kinase/cyclase fusion protein [Marinomonas sp. PE14-40]|uniref:TOMM system kinase/cyclase fusion protein n=1 Tax=Marinomonas sp. PE14-40 TaxID=3060621 RepID=UPI003F67E739
MTLDLSIKNRFHSSNYQLIEMIGQGGFGMVFKARQISTDQIVAIKFLTLSSEFDSEKKQRYLERFQRETALSSRLQHPNIVRLLDKGVCDDDLVYAVFEYVDGKSLKELLSEKGALLPADTANLMGQVLDALSHAHEQGVIHRDLKPANIMLSKLGTKEHIKILDFGIGTLSNEVRQHDYKSITLTNETLGTPSYSAPEQLRGESPSVKSDIYVWGLVFIECLTGEPAITGNSLASIFHKQLSLSNVPIPTAVAGHPVANLLRRVLNKKVNERAGDAGLIYHDLKQININSLVGDLSVKPFSTKNDSLNAIERFDTTDLDVSSNQQGVSENLSIGFQETQINSSLDVNTSLIEKKQISILCVTLALKEIKSLNSEFRELEQLDELHRDSKSQAIDIAIRYGAFHAGTLGDTLLFYFGYPSVSDNDSRLCARAALDITSNIKQRNSLLKVGQSLEIEARMGMHTGIVSHYSDAMPEGGAINVAMELARLSRTNQVLCSQASKRLLDGYIEFKYALNHSVGINKNLEVIHQLIGERLNEAFGFLRGSRSAHAFVGREGEITALKALIDNRHDDYRCAFICGEAGIGKSRLIYEIRNLANKHQFLIGQCLPEHKYSGLYPILSIIKNKYNYLETDEDLERSNFVSNIKEVLAQFSDINESAAIPLILTWLNISIPDNMKVVLLPIEIQRELLFSSLSYLLFYDYFENNSEILFVMEDLHWVDPTTIEFLSYLSNSSILKVRKPLLILTSRKSKSKKLSNLISQNMHLTGLDYEKSKSFISKLFGRKHISNSVLTEVIKRADGIPLFIEELVSMMLDKKLVHHFNGVVDFVSKESAEFIPDSLLESLQQKIDSLVFSKETAQLSAVIGREFDYNVLIESSGFSNEKIQKDLRELFEKDLIYKQRKMDGDVYIFKHALVRDAAYEGISSSTKICFHNAIGESIEKINSDLNFELYETLSYHYEKSNNYSKSAINSMKSAESSLTKGLYEAALVYSKKANESYKKCESDFENKLINNQIMTTSTMMLYGWAGDEVQKLINESQILLSKIDNVNSNSLKLNTYWALATYNNVKGKHSEVYRIIEDALNIDILNKDVFSALYALRAHSLWCQGLMDKALENVNLSLKFYDESGSLDHFVKFGHDTKVFSLSMKALIHATQGEKSKAKLCIESSFLHNKKINSPHSYCMAKVYWCACLYLMDDIDEMSSLIPEIKSIIYENKLVNWEGITNIFNSLLTLDIESAENNFNLLIGIGATQMQGFWNLIISEAEFKKGKVSGSIDRLDKSISQSIENGDHLFVNLQKDLINKINKGI